MKIIISGMSNNHQYLLHIVCYIVTKLTCKNLKVSDWNYTDVKVWNQNKDEL